jgi:hypothetical protein
MCLLLDKYYFPLSEFPMDRYLTTGDDEFHHSLPIYSGEVAGKGQAFVSYAQELHVVTQLFTWSLIVGRWVYN